MMVHEIITNRRSTVIFKDQPIKVEHLESIFEAARWAPSSFNEQPWRFVYALKNDGENWGKLFNSLTPANQSWVKNASVLMVSIAKLNFSRNNQSNKYAIHDVAYAEASMMFQAISVGVFTHPMGGFDNELIRKILELPDDFAPVTMMAMGYKGDIDDFPDDLQARELKARERMPVSEIFSKVKN